jgi:hypothetical protein
MLNWIYGWYESPRHGTPEELAQSIFRIALSGLVGKSVDRGWLRRLERKHDRAGAPVLLPEES